MIIGAGLGIALLVTHLNIMNLVCYIYLMLSGVIMVLTVFTKKTVHLPYLIGYAATALCMILFHIIWGADAGFGAFSTGLAGFSSEEYSLFTGEGNIFTRLCGNLILALPCIIALVLLFVFKKKQTDTPLADGITLKVKKPVAQGILSVLLTLLTVVWLLTGNLRTKPVDSSLWDGQEDYLSKVDKADKDSPNVLVILTDDLGYGDISLNGAVYDTPNIDSIGENGVTFENFYSSYSVCSPARFACLTGRYPYRGYADNVIYPTVSTFKPFAATRLYNSFEMGGNVDGMTGDEITMAEVFKAAGYNTAAFGKWHLGDYGEYLPTNQGFDYFYGSHYVNDMTPLYHVSEENGEYTIVHGTDELEDQSMATEWIYEEMESWLKETALDSDEPFFLYYATPWPHAPVYAGDEFDGVSGMGTYVDCITEFDTYLGYLFDVLEEAGELDNTIIVFTSDNGPALEGSTGILRGGKYLAYEGGQKVPFMIRWDNNDGLFEAGSTRTSAATLVDLFPTLLDLCGISVDGSDSNLPTDRVIDGESMVSLLKSDKVIHDESSPILYMKRENLKAIQYSIPSKEVKAEYPDYDYDVLKNKNINFKYFQRIQNDNFAFFDKFRKNWLHILNDDPGENYNRSSVYPTIAAEMSDKMDEIMEDFKQNRRGIINDEN